MTKVAESSHLSSKTSRTSWLFREIADSQVNSLRDTEGRPLGEQRSTVKYDSVVTEFARCPYRGSRYHHDKPMNVSALRQAVAHRPDIFGGLALVRQEYQEQVDAASLTRFDLWRLVNIGICLPSFAALRAVDPLHDTEVPVWLAGIYKVLIGVHVPVGQLMLEDLLRGGTPSPMPSAEMLLEYVESNRYLIGVTEVCAAPPTLILEALRVILSGDLGGAEIDPAPFNATLGDVGSVLAYALGTVDLLILNFNFAARTRCDAFRLATLVQQVVEDQGPSPLAEALLSRLGLLAEEQAGHTIDFCRRVEKVIGNIPGLDMRVVASMLDKKITQPVKAEPARSARPRRLPAPGTQDPLARLVQEEWASYQAHERTFLANATALSHSILAILGYPAEAAKIRHEDLAVFMGKNLGDLLQGISEEFSLEPAPRGRQGAGRKRLPSTGDDGESERALH